MSNHLNNPGNDSSYPSMLAVMADLSNWAEDVSTPDIFSKFKEI
jgi:hypothetical protein